MTEYVFELRMHSNATWPEFESAAMDVVLKLLAAANLTSFADLRRCGSRPTEIEEVRIFTGSVLLPVTAP